MFDRGYHHGVNHPWFWILVLLMVAVAVAVLIWALVRNSHRTYQIPPPGPPTDPAMETLRMRFAHGEIDSDEYATRAAQLSGMFPPAPQPPGPPPS
jgi:uncharacterized membrane protein